MGFTNPRRLAPILFAALALLALAACNSNGGGSAPDTTGSPSLLNESTVVPITPVDKPSSVPDAAAQVDATMELGRITRAAGAEPQGEETRRLINVDCRDGVMIMRTSEETVYAALPCDRFLEPATLVSFLSEDVAIVLEVSDVRYRVLLETLMGAQAEFTVNGIWREEA